jgi:hypothetical protein
MSDEDSGVQIPPFALLFPLETGFLGALANFRGLDSSDRVMNDIEKAWQKMQPRQDAIIKVRKETMLDLAGAYFP